MEDIVRLLIGVAILVVGFPLGSYLASITKEELKSGQRWFRLLIILSLIGGFIGLILGNDVIMFSCFFIAIVTSRSSKK
jgi:hypothetical protein